MSKTSKIVSEIDILPANRFAPACLVGIVREDRTWYSESEDLLKRFHNLPQD
jgi:hypothetical protein